MERVKYPRTMHLAWSPGLYNDDRVIKTLDHLRGHEVVVTEKMDGENLTIYHDFLHARSINGRHHPSRDWIKRFWGEALAFRIPPGDRICGENMYARHSIAYEDLDTYFYGFSYWDHDICLGWDDTLQMFDHFGVQPVPELWRGEFDENILYEIADSLDLERQEGYVVRVTKSFTMAQFPVKVAKWVRPQHVQTKTHWMHNEIIPNGLKEQHNDS